MGWWWSSKPSSSSDNSIKTSQPDNPLEGQSPSTISAHESPPARQLTREEQADAELRDFLKSLESSITPPTTASSSTTTSSRSQASKSTLDDTIQQQQQQEQEQNTPNSIAPDSLYPDTMSCRSAFDYAFFCQSFGGQWVNVYRYGELRSCSEHWENFWLCMKARGVKDDDTRKEMIRNHYRKKAVKYKTGPSSEDVWEVRLEPLKGAFQGDFEKLEREQELAEQQQQQQYKTMEKAVTDS